MHVRVYRLTKPFSKRNQFKVMLICGYLYRKACQVLTTLGSDVNTRDSNRWTPLMWAASSGCEKTSQELLDKQAVVDHVNNQGDSALHISASHGKVKVVELLLNYGADVRIRNNLGQTCLDVTVQSGAGDVALAIARNKRLVRLFLVCEINCDCFFD